ncbi:hypothetical protein EYF80_018157 [Liparis tanakae]|uniref:Uncharacterized protein n=1 Tax=Liparis tanakae TaxID=230148 RepID=A0A4Z2I301_9TELE|nr:hypothetical protein EYF80_018157 [Liparis tanakae]
MERDRSSGRANSTKRLLEWTGRGDKQADGRLCNKSQARRKKINYSRGQKKKKKKRAKKKKKKKKKKKHEEEEEEEEA